VKLRSPFIGKDIYPKNYSMKIPKTPPSVENFIKKGILPIN